MPIVDFNSTINNPQSTTIQQSRIVKSPIQGFIPSMMALRVALGPHRLRRLCRVGVIVATNLD
jgi:hypothetical protein